MKRNIDDWIASDENNSSGEEASTGATKKAFHNATVAFQGASIGLSLAPQLITDTEDALATAEDVFAVLRIASQIVRAVISDGCAVYRRERLEELLNAAKDSAEKSVLCQIFVYDREKDALWSRTSADGVFVSLRVEADNIFERALNERAVMIATKEGTIVDGTRAFQEIDKKEGKAERTERVNTQNDR